MGSVFFVHFCFNRSIICSQVEIVFLFQAIFSPDQWLLGTKHFIPIFNDSA